MGRARDMADAFALMTVLPVPDSGAHKPTSRASAWFPWVGLFIGSVVLSLLVILNSVSVALGDGEFLSRAAWPLATLVVGISAVLTRFLHWDGLADLGDAWWGGADKARRLEIMADSHVGAFGVATVVLVAVMQVVCVSTLLTHVGFGIALFAAPVFARMAATFGSWLGSPARPDGLGACVMGSPGVIEIVIATFALGIAAASMGYEHGVAGWVWSGFAFVVAAVVPHLCAQRVGGVTGDVLGASVLVTEMIVLFAAAMVVSW
ncbi:MAG: adenosylcobinamide-GDP ribazoletransferase [Coriobacteriia bacterium]|nr:adenosylcobinamide-GDP ribazoletransferase [Coriobacteriia bacterium]